MVLAQELAHGLSLANAGPSASVVEGIAQRTRPWREIQRPIIPVTNFATCGTRENGLGMAEFEGR